MNIFAALKAPPKVVDAIVKWAWEEVSNTMLGIVERRYVSQVAMSKDKDTDKHFRKQFADKAKSTKTLLDEVKKTASKSEGERPLAFTQIKVDLSGWSYPKPSPPPTHLLAMVMFTDPVVKFGAAQFLEGSALDTTSAGTINIYATTSKLADTFTPGEWKRCLQRIETSVEHESQHLAQALLRLATGQEGAGNPGNRKRNVEPIDPLKNPEKYHLQPQEFWPLIDSAAREIRLKLDEVPETERASELRKLLDKEPLLKSLQKNDRSLWMKAVRELTKKLGPEGMPVRLALRFSC